MSKSPLPLQIRKCCLLLGIQPEHLTIESVNEAWKRQVSAPGAHPAIDGNVDLVWDLNAAKDTLTKWLQS